MTKSSETICLIPIEAVRVLNPRERNQSKFRSIVENIDRVGLKRPITVAARPTDPDGLVLYDLVCGQGRMEALEMLGETLVPARIIAADKQDCMISSLIENCARRKLDPLDLLRAIGEMRARGYSDREIASKIGLSHDYVHAVARLQEKGEERLLKAAEAGQIPFTVALEIAEVEDKDAQAALQCAYERDLLRGRSLAIAKRLIEVRRSKGKTLRRAANAIPLSSHTLIRAFTREADRKRALVARAEKIKGQIALVAGSMRRLLQDEVLREIMLREDLMTMPEALAGRLKVRETVQ
ncbi:plasmid partitioning protein RepB C-terminal domain-containing protein [Hyphomicrobiales bacterium]|uniref:ParB/RepB/Spo0J family partition protein n=1 Tax=Rhizobium sp. Rhizsp82 TaxID=3243057 RepID=UPI000DD764DA